MRRKILNTAAAGLVLLLGLGLSSCKGVSVNLGSISTPAPGTGPASSSGAGTGEVAGAGGPAGATGSGGGLTVLAEPGAGFSEIYKLITSAHHSVELTMYELRDTTAEADLAADAKRGVDVQVVLDQHLEKARNQATYSYLTAHGVHVAWAPKSITYHQKTLTIDGKTSVVMTLNMVSSDYAGTRDFAVIDTKPADISAIVTTFNADFGGHGKGYSPPDGADLVWSPTNSQSVILSVIGGARHTLAIENEEMGDSKVTNALIAAAQRGVNVTVTMTAQSSWDSAFRKLVKAGAHVHTYRDSTKVLYIHAKVVLADAGLADRRVFVGSENFSVASLRVNRELGVVTTQPALISVISATLVRDYAGATPFSS
ncbi:MAG TPA: phospholipase D-like domain-containing protein [Trebonia sp.]|jgi:phosphatidylserine/phosphatidylglycerophosphate/cardiolipin synthase-like enzyme|nr:phospholipase D-like domain-containing protein [Trebonia sp.]